MTGSLSLEDTIHVALREVGVGLIGDSLKHVADAVRAASVVPAEPATHERHGFYDHEDDDGFHYATCMCGWQGPPVPDVEDAADTYGDHRVLRVRAAVAGCVAPRVDPASGWGGPGQRGGNRRTTSTHVTACPTCGGSGLASVGSTPIPEGHE